MSQPVELGEGTPAATENAQAPFVVCLTFRNPRADLVLVSSDGIEFRVHKVFLEEASVVFHDMFSHPQPSSSRTSDTVPWPEPAATIDHLLRLIYPIVPKPTVETLDECIRLLQAADKWQLDYAVFLLRRELVEPRFLEHGALKAYAFACNMGYEEEKQVSRTHAITRDPCDHATRDQLAHMSALDLLRLVHLRAGLGVHYMVVSDPSDVPPTTSMPSSSNFEIFDDLKADVVLECVDGSKFRAHQHLLRAVSPVFKQMLKEANSKLSSPDDSSPTLSLPESAYDICALLHLIYPVAKPEIQRSLEDVIRLTVTAAKYQLDVAMWHLKQELVSDRHLQLKPIRIYGFASRMGLEAEKKKALVKAIRNDVLFHRAAEDFRDMPALDLLKIVDSRRHLVHQATNLVAAWEITHPDNCRHHYSSHNASNAALNLKAYLQESMAVTPFSDAVTSAQALSRFVTFQPYGSGFCDACFKDVSSVSRQHIELASLMGGLDYLLNTL